MPAVEPISDAHCISIGEQLWARNAGRLWSNINPTERVFMAYANPGACWAASDEALKPMSPSGLHRA